LDKLLKFFYIFCLACTGAEMFKENMMCGKYEHVTGSKTELTNTSEKCNTIVLNECLQKDYFTWRKKNNACHCVVENNCDSPRNSSGLNIYQTCTPSGKLCQFKEVTRTGDLQRL
jgi:hypothetical protein